MDLTFILNVTIGTLVYMLGIGKSYQVIALHNEDWVDECGQPCDQSFRTALAALCWVIYWPTYFVGYAIQTIHNVNSKVYNRIRSNPPKKLPASTDPLVEEALIALKAELAQDVGSQICLTSTTVYSDFVKRHVSLEDHLAAWHVWRSHTDLELFKKKYKGGLLSAEDIRKYNTHLDLTDKEFHQSVVDAPYELV